MITGSAGFIGFHLAQTFLSKKWKVVGFDAMTNYYDVNLKKNRHSILEKNPEFIAYNGLLQDPKLLKEVYERHKPNIIIHLAAQAGVRYSIDNPISYVESNLIGTFHLLELARKYKPEHLLMASTSSVYGSNREMPLHENQKSDTPMSFYAATKKSNEAMAHSYSHLYNVPITMFRFFTVYGPWGRPDMVRDFTYVDDLVKAIYLLSFKNPDKIQISKEIIKNDSLSDVAPFRIVNIGNSNPVNLLDFIRELEKVLGVNAKKNFLGMQDGDIYKTHSNTTLLRNLIGFQPKTSVQEGITRFVEWYKSYYQ